jgi:hypothetical protein
VSSLFLLLKPEETNSDKTLTGNLTVLVSDYISFGGSISTVGISTLDVNQGILYFATDSDEQLIWAVDINQRRLLPPMDLGAPKRILQ